LIGLGYPLRIRRKQNTKNEIASVAFSLFRQHGYDRVSIEMISAAAGISRATFFNYFPQKDLLLNELAAIRAERIKAKFAEYRNSGRDFTLDSLRNLLLDMCAENARISLASKKLLLEAVFRQMSSGSLLAARDQVVAELSKILAGIPGHKKSARQTAETIFSLFLATMLEWLMREGAPESWLTKNMKARLELLMRGIQ
jgi:AcrR family transcriptional regulator